MLVTGTRPSCLGILILLIPVNLLMFALNALLDKLSESPGDLQRDLTGDETAGEGATAEESENSPPTSEGDAEGAAASPDTVLPWTAAGARVPHACRQCGNPNDPDAAFCTQCGNKLLDDDSVESPQSDSESAERRIAEEAAARPAPFCYHCGGVVDRDETECPHCGKQL